MALPTLQALTQSDHEVVGVLTRPPARRGRRAAPTPSPVATWARERELKVLEAARPGQVAEELAALGADLGVVVAYGAILRPEVLEIPTRGWLNLHFSDLPRWRGAAPVQWAIRAGDQHSATCVFQLEAGLDTGPVYSRLPVELTGRETAGELLERLAPVGAQQVVEVVDQLAAGTAVATPQASEGLTTAPQLTKQDGYVSFAGSADETDRQIRSVTPNPGAWTQLPSGQVLRLGAATPLESDPELALAPGQVHADKHQVLVGCERGMLRLGQVAPAGKNWMEAPAWARGARGITTMGGHRE